MFYPSVFGAKYKEKDKQGLEVEVELRPIELVNEMLKVRARHAYGFQQDYFDDAHLVGWTRHGEATAGTRGCAVLISNQGEGEKRMSLGQHNARGVMVDITDASRIVQLDDEGYGTFHVKAGSVSVWIEKGTSMSGTG